MKLYVTRDYEEMSLKVADIIAAQMILKPDTVLGLATGTTPVGAYNSLIERNKTGSVDFSSVRTVNLDEYWELPSDHDQSYRYFMDHHLFNNVNILPENTNLPNGMASDKDSECRRYDSLIEELGGIDIQLLGLGHNGHIGFNEPDDVFYKGTHVVKLTESTIQANSRLFNNSDEVPRYAITMGIAAIMNARTVVLAVSGSGKAKALRDSLKGPVSPMVPGSILQLHSNIYVVADAEAASLL